MRETSLKQNVDQISPLLAGSQKMALATLRLQAQAYRSGIQFQMEMLDFLRHRLERDVQFVDDLSRSEEFDDAVDVMSTFVQESATEYSAEASRLSAIGSDIVSDTVDNGRGKPDGRSRNTAARSAG